jgi:CDP-diacylglycerol--glycerol-3-phosphate 3-phosphatidyltransferase/cardiolipin synthase
MLDPIADKLLVSAVILVLAADQTISGLSLWAAIVILCREILVSGLREYLAELRVPLPVTALAKWKTAVQFVALGFLIVGPAGEALLPGSITTGIVLLWIAAILTLYTGWDYMKASYDHAGGD